MILLAEMEALTLCKSWMLVMVLPFKRRCEGPKSFPRRPVATSDDFWLDFNGEAVSSRRVLISLVVIVVLGALPKLPLLEPLLCYLM